MTTRTPIPSLGNEERARRLRELGRNPDLTPITPHPWDTMPETTEQPAAVVASPAAGAVLSQKLTRILTAVGVIAAAALAASEAGILPAWVSAVAQAIIGLLAAVGIASPGIRKQA